LLFLAKLCMRWMLGQTSLRFLLVSVSLALYKIHLPQNDESKV